MTKTTMRKMMMLLTGKAKPVDVWHYFLGNYRYSLFFAEDSCFIHTDGTFTTIKSPFMRKHIYEQIKWRIKTMKQECYELGQCVKCGCDTPHLQMANKACEGKCYPPMLNKDDWEAFKFINKITI